MSTSPEPVAAPAAENPVGPAGAGVPAPPEAIAADDHADDNADADSAYESITSDSTSLTSSIAKYRQENGRTYHSYKEGKYVFPNDETENDRLDLQHHLFTLTLDGKLHACPAGEGKPLRRVLDAGTGTGIWALDIADEHPETHVIGVDLSPIQPKFSPPNVSFYVDDLEEPWTYTDKFDLIYGRMLVGSLANWPKFMENAFENLNPGGWVELADIHVKATCDDGTLPKDSALYKWSELFNDAAAAYGRPADCAKLYKEQMEAAGFVNVTQRVYKWPMNTWPRDKKYKELGMWAEQNLLNGLYAFSAALFTRALGWSPEELELFLVDVRKNVRDRSIHSYWPIYVVYGQKPE